MTADSAPHPLSKPVSGRKRRSAQSTFQFQSHRRLRGVHILLVFVGFGGALLAFSFAVWRWYFAYRHFGPAVVWRWASPALGVSAGLTLVGCFGAFSLWRLRGMVVSTHDSSLVISRGDHRITVPWKEIDEVYTSVVRYGFLSASQENRVRLALRLKNGRRIRFSDAIEDLPRLGDEIKRHVYPRLLEAKRQAFNQGDALSFGPLTLTTSHLKLRSRRLRWKQLESVQLREGMLEIIPKPATRKGKMQVPARKIPNVDLSLQLIQGLIQAGRTHRVNEANDEWG